MEKQFNMKMDKALKRLDPSQSLIRLIRAEKVSES
jgi:hypothetical protein